MKFKSAFTLVLIFAAAFFASCSQNQNSAVTQTESNQAAANAQPAEIAAPQSEKAEIAEAGALKKQAEEMNLAFVKGDYKRLIDLTHPKVIEMNGGREKMLASIKSELNSMKTQGFEVTDSTIGEAEKPVKIDNQLFAVVPTKTTIKAPKGRAEHESFIVGVSEDNGANWKFVNALDKDRFKTMFPEAVGKLQLPEEKKPVVFQDK